MTDLYLEQDRDKLKENIRVLTLDTASMSYYEVEKAKVKLLLWQKELDCINKILNE